MSTIDNALEMPQWKRDLIMRRRAQHRDNATTSSSSSVNKQLSSESLHVQSKTVRCASCGSCSSSQQESSSVALGCRPPLGHQPNNTNNLRTASSSGGSACSHRNRNPSTAAASATSNSCCALAFSSSSPSAVCECGLLVQQQCNTCCSQCNKMVHLHNDSDSSEELAYGPGIVSKLKNRYLSLTLRETVIKRRPSILRKATSLENLLDDDQEHISERDEHDTNTTKLKRSRLYETRTNGTVAGLNNAKNVPVPANRYLRSSSRGTMKRARSVEAISRIWSPQHQPDEPATNGTARPKSLQNEEEFTFAINPIITPRVNKPKRITPVITEREKPPADVVKQTKRIFEARPESRTRPPQHTGEVAAKVATYKTIIIQNKHNKPAIKQKPNLSDEHPHLNILNNKTRTKPTRLNLKSSIDDSSPILSPTIVTNGNSNGVNGLPNTLLPSPIPDVSMVNDDEESHKATSLSETPDLILHSSPQQKQYDQLVECQDFLDLMEKLDKANNAEFLHAEIVHNNLTSYDNTKTGATFETKETVVKMAPLSPPPPPPVAKTEPLTLDINHFTTASNKTSATSPATITLTNNRDPVLVLSPREIEKNAINAAVSPPVLQKPPTVPNVINNKQDESPKQVAPKAKTRKSKQAPLGLGQEQNCIVFKFTDRKDVPDYIGNDGMNRTQTRIDIPKVGDGGVTLLPGTTIQDVFKDYDEELRSLEGPPSPCDVLFINDNILIDGKSSLSNKSKRSKMRIKFVEAIPQVFEYPSEASMLVDENMAQPLGGTTVPSLSGSTLANYMPKAASSDFQLGVTKAPLPTPSVEYKEHKESEDVIDKREEPILFSSGVNSDILF